MAELVNLRAVRKRAKRQLAVHHAHANRLAHSQPKHQRTLEGARQIKASRDLDQHRIEKGDGR